MQVKISTKGNVRRKETRNVIYQRGMEILKTVLILSAFLVCYADAFRSKNVYNVSIDESGTRFNETVEINTRKNSVVYKVPKHNTIAQSETLFDYKSGYFATRIPKLKECYIQRIPKGQSSPRYVQKYLQQYQVFQKRRSTVPVRIIATGVIKERRIDPQELSSSLLAFCGEFVAYKGRQVYHTNDYQIKRNEKSGKEVRRNVRSAAVVLSVDVELPINGTWKTITFAKCKKLEEYMPELKRGGCHRNPDSWEYHCHAKTQSCMYTVKCRLTSTGDGDERRIRCEETHFFTGWTCCDLKCGS